MLLIEVLPKNEFGIVLSPCAEMNGQYYDGTVNIEWFQAAFPELAAATVPLSDADFNDLKSIDQYWSINAERWRLEKII